MIPTSEAARVILTHLLEIGVYALVIFGAVLAFRRVFHNKTRPALRFGLWLLLLLRLTVPFTVNSAIHLIVLPASQPTEAVAARTEASARPIRPAAATNPTARPTGAPEAAKAPTEETQAEPWSAGRGCDACWPPASGPAPGCPIPGPWGNLGGSAIGCTSGGPCGSWRWRTSPAPP